MFKKIENKGYDDQEWKMNFSLNSLFEQLALPTCVKGQQRNKKNASSSAEVERRRVYPNTATSGTDSNFM